MVRTLNFPMDDEDYSSLSIKKEAVAKALGVSDLTWKQFMFLMKKTPIRTLAKAGRVLKFDSKDDSKGSRSE